MKSLNHLLCRLAARPLRVGRESCDGVRGLGAILEQTVAFLIRKGFGNLETPPGVVGIFSYFTGDGVRSCVDGLRLIRFKAALASV